ncbi:hypothetical protein PHLCEN_2v1786 [Hermanssonia centrifuga]|uniref:Cytochrome P450 n=1 Tax=Hermanssonia centrifuga TaxID=98765 RepID=A0A2R6RVX8_9APHY|nr:hypothetical protein PHLCEN_2v1786 [Hermanssonia centrifuga]
MDDTSKELFALRKAAFAKGDKAVLEQVGEGKDIMSILLNANMHSTESDRLTDEELVAQMSTMLFAGTDTTSNALARTLHLLSMHPDVQERLRDEIIQAADTYGQDIPYEQLFELPFLDAVCRETLRVDMPLNFIVRETVGDSVLPLHQAITGIDGTPIHEIAVPKGTMVLVALAACNRSRAVWGEDALEWKPERWLSALPETVGQARVPGVYSNLMTFSGGGRSCIGFRFSQLEMKVVLAVLLQHFRFSLTDKKIVWNFSGIHFPSMHTDGTTPSLILKVQPLREE